MPDNRTKASIIVNGVMYDLGGRKGIGNELESYDNTISLEIVTDLIDLIEGYLDKWQEEEQ